MRTHGRQQGTALITALFIMTMVAAASVAMLWRQSVSIQQTASILHHHSMELAADGVTLWAITSLTVNINHPHADQLIDTIPMVYPQTPLNGMVIAGQVDDELGKFNINTVSDPASYAIFLRLIKTVYPAIEKPEAIADATISWIAPFHMGSSQYDELYKKEKTGYLPAHKFMVDISELRLVEGVTAELMTALMPYVTALPEATKINVNTAPAVVLMSVVSGMPLEVATKIVSERQQQPFLAPQDFIDHPDVKRFQFSNPDAITTVSNYFLNHAFITLGQESLTVNSLIKRDRDSKGNRVIILWQNQQ